LATTPHPRSSSIAEPIVSLRKISPKLTGGPPRLVRSSRARRRRYGYRVCTLGVPII
jgi:hypothetical protein